MAMSTALSRVSPGERERVWSAYNEFISSNPQTQAVAAAPTTTASPMGGRGASRPKKEFVMVPVLYATDREPIKGLTLDQWREQFRAKGSQVAYFSDEHDNTRIHYGYCTVSVPEAVHRAGDLERPPWYRKENLVYDITLRRLIPLKPGQMKERIAQLASRSADNDAFVFIHGYNVAFNDAVMRTAQISYDFAFRGAPILFSWPSSGALRDYARDGESIDLAVDSLHHFLDDIVLKTGAKKIHLVAHSMGNRLLLRTLKKFSDQGRSALFGEIIFAAADVPKREFTAADPRKIAALGRRVTIYASSKDHALVASARFNNSDRLGESGAKLFLADGIDSIDASEVDTDMLHHSYFANARPVILDLARLLALGVAPNVKPRELKPDTRGDLRFWLVGRPAK